MGRRVGYCNRLAEPPPITLFRFTARQPPIHCTPPGALFYETPKIRNPGCNPRSSIYGDACFVYLPKLLLSELLSELFLAAVVTDIGTHGCKKLQMTPFELEPKLEGSYRKSAGRPRPD
jgi:hypothetical protein